MNMKKLLFFLLLQLFKPLPIRLKLIRQASGCQLFPGKDIVWFF